MEIINGWTVNPYECSKCQTILSFVDGDNLQSCRASFDNFKKALSLDTRLQVLQCDQCKKTYHLVFLSVIQATNLSSDWVNAYFWMNAPPEENEIFITVDWQKKIKGFSSICPASVTELSEGRLFRFWLGPLKLGTTGPNHEKFFEWVDIALSLFVAENLSFRSLP